MAVIKPFRGVYYNQERIGDLSAVVTPPYDVISPADEELYRKRHQNNIVRLILPRENSGGDKYSNAGAILDEWIDNGIFVQDDQPCFYACVQEYSLNGERKRRLGLTCLVHLEDFDRRTVLPHENIMAKPLEDRLNLMRATRANLESVFSLHADGRVRDILRPFIARPPDASAADKDGVKCDLWRISDPTAIRSIPDILAQESVVIADGHHRYSAALAYRNEVRALYGECDPDAPAEYIMMTLVSLDDPGLVVLPTHRLVRNVEGFDPAGFSAQVAEFFDIKEMPVRQLEEGVASSNGTRNTFGLYMSGGKSYILKLKPTVAPENAIESHGSDALKRLDVSVLHSLILDKLLGVGVQQMAAGNNVTFTRDVQGAMASVDKGEYQMLVLMNPTKVEEVQAVTSLGERMPQKSTFFYPKLLTGMVMRVME